MRPPSEALVRFPAPGEALDLRPLERQIFWYFVHHVEGGRAPCLGQGCVLCKGGTTRPHRTWEGYLLCIDAASVPDYLVARFTASIWDTASNLHGIMDDLRDTMLVYDRKPGRGAPRLTLQVFEARYVDGRPFPADACHWPAVCRWWRLAGRSADYRYDLNWKQLARVAPSADADPISPAPAFLPTGERP